MKEKKKYRLYVDEIGISGFSNKVEEINDRYFGLCGVILEHSETEKLNEKFINLRKTLTNDLDDLSDIHLHRRDIVQKKGYFKVLENEKIREKFDLILLDIFEFIDYKIIFVGFDKKKFLDSGNSPVNIYHYLMNIIIEKYILELEKIVAKGDIMFECSGPKEDLLLQKEYRHFCEIGSNSFPPNRILNSITSKNIKFKNKNKNISGLELADLLAWCSLGSLLEDEHLKRISKDQFNMQIFKAIIRKFAFKGKILI